MQENKSLNDPSEILDSSTIFRSKGLSNLCWIVLLLVLAITLLVGLLPRGSFKENWLEWDERSSRTEFGSYGVVQGGFPDLSESLDQHHQLIFDFAIVPRSFSGSEFRIFLQLDYLDDPEPFLIGQWENLLIVMQGDDLANEEGLLRLTMDVGEFIGEELNVLVKLNQDKNELYLNGQLVRQHSPSIYELGKKNARITIGNSPDGKHGWFGGVAKFDVILLSLQNEQSELLRSYDFNSRFEDEIKDLSENAISLRVPKPGNFPDKRVLQITEFDDIFIKNRIDLIINFVGFWPLGFFVAIVFWQKIPTSRFYLLPLCGAVLVGGLISFGIEISQPLIPGRNSHFHDLVLNILGAAAGGLGFVIFSYIILKLKRV